MSSISPITLNGTQLKPAPFVSTSYEYNTSGQYVVGGFLIVNLSGTLVGEDIVDQIASMGALQVNQNCVNLIIGCQGGSDFLDGNGRIRSVDVSSSDQPFTANYTITIALETVGGQPAVEADPDFLTRNCLTADDAKFIQSYSENIGIDAGADNYALVDNDFGVSKSYVKGKGSISVTCFGREVCGLPSYSGIDSALKILDKRAKSLMSFDICDDSANPLANYSGWSKWVDTKSLEINDTGNVTWNFDLYMSKGGCAPYAWVDLNADEKIDLQSGTQEKKTRNISGTIRGLCFATDNLLKNHAGDGDRLNNAKRALNIILPQIIDGEWPEITASISGGQPGSNPQPPSECPPNEEETCYQRISSNISTSVVAAEITFSAEYGPINSCEATTDAAVIDSTIDERLPATKHVEFIIPNLGNSIIQVIGDTPHEATITVRGTLKGCDQGSMTTVINCVQQQMNNLAKKYSGWLQKSSNAAVGTFSYVLTKTFIKCDL
jgi:hypothetical protein